MMVSKHKKELTDEEVSEIMNEKTNHSDHVRSRNYDKNCYWCIAFGFISAESPEKPSES